MQLQKSVTWLAGLLLLLLSALPAPSLAGTASSLVLPVAGEHRIMPDGPSIEVHSWEKEGLLGAKVEGVLGYPFAKIEDALSRPEPWCEFIPLVFNVKSCTFRHQDDQALLSVYIGRKSFEPPQEAMRLDYRFQVLKREQDRFQILLSAPEGPWGTRAYQIELEAQKAGEGRTRFHMHSSFRPSLRSTVATNAYLATAGRSKVGFSVAGQVEDGPVYVGGMKGVIERNAMRYFLALQAFLDTLHLPADRRFEARLDAWYGSTERYRRQLYEMERQEYLEVKRQERSYQLQLQQGLGS